MMAETRSSGRIELLPDTLNPSSAYHAHAFIAAYLDRGIPVLIHETGHHPAALLPDDTSTRDEPHIPITTSGGTDRDGPFWDGVGVSAVGRFVGGFRRALKVYGRSDLQTRSRDRAPLVAEGETQIPRAHVVLAGLDAAYGAAAARTACLKDWRRALTREEYERACAECGVRARHDDQCSTWGSFSFPEYTPDQVVAAVLAQNRGAYIERQARQAQEARSAEAMRRPRPAPPMEGQLWEGCERCDREPCYLPLMLCENCWPKAA